MNKESIKKVHDRTFNAIVENHPELEVNTLINQGIMLLTGQTSADEIFQKYGPIVKDSAQCYVKSFSHDLISDEIKMRLKGSNIQDVKNLAKGKFADDAINAGVSAAVIVKAFCCNEIDAQTMMTRLGNCGAKEVGLKLLKAEGIDLKAIMDKIPEVLESGSYAVALAALLEALRIMEVELNQASMVHEEMLAFKAEHDKTAALIREYRLALNQKITTYFENNYRVIESGFVAMDKALVENDSDGYLKANSEVQLLLQYDSQFSNQEEFDDLMSSDNYFKL